MFGNNNHLSAYDDDDDDASFVPLKSSTSNLASLFTAPDSNAATLKYTPPKQSAKSSAKTKTLTCFKTISLSRVQDGTFASIGRFGIAIVASELEAHLLVYKTKASILSTSLLNCYFRCTLIDGVTLQFVDDSGERWRVEFDNEKEQMDVVDELGKHSVCVETGAEEASTSDAPPPDVVVSNPMPKEDQARADILERISKVGKLIAPNRQNCSETVKQNKEEDDESSCSQMVRKHLPRHSDSFIDTRMNKTCISPTPLLDPFNIYFTENRTHNAEVRMNLTALTTKMDLLLMQNASAACSTNAMFERRIAELEQRLSAQQSDDSHLKQQIVDLEETLCRKEEELAIARREWTKIESNLIAKNENLQRIIDEQKVYLDSQHQSKESTQSEHLVEVTRLQSLLEDASSQYNSLLQARVQEEHLLTDVVKNAMNTLYEKIMRVYAQKPQCSGVLKDLKKLHQDQLRVTTFQIIHDFIRERNKHPTSNTIEVSPEFEVTV